MSYYSPRTLAGEAREAKRIMSKNLDIAPIYLNEALQDVFEAIVERNGGTVTKAVAHKTQLDLEATFDDKKYVIMLKLEWTGTHYVVEKFSSFQVVEEWGDHAYLQAERALTCQVGTGTWQIFAPIGLYALLKAHTRWSKVFGCQPIFSFD